MPFIPVISGPGPRVTGCRCRFYVTPQRNGRFRCGFLLSRELTEKLGWQAGDRFIVSLGTDTHAGAFQISRVTRPRAASKLIANPGSHGALVYITLPPTVREVATADLLAGITEPINLDVTISGGVLDLRIPAMTASNVAPLARKGG